MSRISTERRLWKCPGCGRSFRIPAGAESPRLCPDCIAGEATVALDRAADEPGVPAPAAALSRDISPADPDATAESLRKVSEQLEAISRSVLVMRRLMWGLVIGVAVYALLYGAYVLFMLKTVRQAQDLPGNLDRLLEPMQEYRRALDDALR